VSTTDSRVSFVKLKVGRDFSEVDGLRVSLAIVQIVLALSSGGFFCRISLCLCVKSVVVAEASGTLLGLVLQGHRSVVKTV
jgi:hypothetical protein